MKKKAEFPMFILVKKIVEELEKEKNYDLRITIKWSANFEFEESLGSLYTRWREILDNALKESKSPSPSGATHGFLCKYVRAKLRNSL